MRRKHKRIAEEHFRCVDHLTRCESHTEIGVSVMLRGGVVEDFYRGFAQRTRDLAEKADPFTRRRLLDLTQRYDLKSRPGSGNDGLCRRRARRRRRCSSPAQAKPKALLPGGAVRSDSASVCASAFPRPERVHRAPHARLRFRELAPRALVWPSEIGPCSCDGILRARSLLRADRLLFPPLRPLRTRHVVRHWCRASRLQA